MKINYLIFFSVLPLILNSGCSHSKGEATAEAREVVYQTSLVKEKDIKTNLILPGELEGYYETAIMAKVNGYAKQVLADIGDHVSEGQLLVTLEAPELMSQLSEALAEVKSKEAIYLNTKGRFTRLVQTNKTQGAVSPYDMDLGKTNIIADSLASNAATAKYNAVKQLTNYLSITAPFDGIITERTVAPGSFVGPRETEKPIYKLKSESKLRLHIAVPEKHIAEIHNGSVVKFSVKSFPDNVFEGTVTRLSKSLNIQTRSEMIEILFDNKAHKLLPGMYANAILPLQRPEASLVVPQTAVVTNMERSFVIKVNKNGTTTWVDVQKGEEDGNEVEVFGEIIPGDTIIKTASDEIKNHAAIKSIMASN
jgi:RND family efflux transporter MFP subunit